MSADTAIATAKRLLSKYGESATFTYVTGSDIDPATGEVTDAGDDVDIVANVYLGRYEKADIDNTNVLATDGRLIVEKIAIEPKSGWDVSVNSVDYRIMDVRTIRMSAKDVIYICQVRAN